MSGSDLLFYALIVAGVLLFNYVTRRLAMKAREQEGGPSGTPPPQPMTEEAMDYSWGRSTAPLAEAYKLEGRRIEGTAAQPAAPAAASAARPRRAAHLHPAVRRLLADERELRNAIVLAVVLGPCRARAPHDERDR